MAGPTEIATILSQAGRIEKIQQNPLVQSEVTKHILTEEEARARMQRAREVNEAKKPQEISISEKGRQESRRRASDASRRTEDENTAEASRDDTPGDGTHLIDVVV